MITILCSGSRGDIQPYIALAQELKQQENDVRIVAGESFKNFVESYGVSCYPLSADFKNVDVDPKLLESARNSTNPFKMLLTFNKMKKYARLMVDEMYEACQGSELIVYHPGCTIGYFAAEQMGIPSVMAAPFPMHQTKEVASVIAYGKTKMSAKMSYTMLQNMLWMASKTGVKSFWKEKFGHLPQHFACPFERVDENHPSIVSCSNYVFNRPSDWNQNIHQYGYWFLKEPSDYIAPKELMEFLNAGEKPIYFGFGSVFNEKDKTVFVESIIDALNRTRKRGILCGMGKLEHLPQNIFAIESVSHAWLFPRCVAVCHHGGAGTTAAGFAAGIPSIIVPFSNDQFAWAHRSFDIGVGSKPIYKKNFSAEALIQSINFVLSDKIVENAKKMGKSISTENGSRDCAKVISDLVR